MAKANVKERLNRFRDSWIEMYGEEPSALTLEILERCILYMDDRIMEGATLQEAFGEIIGLMESIRKKRSA